jgi:hypothetical protein
MTAGVCWHFPTSHHHTWLGQFGTVAMVTQIEDMDTDEWEYEYDTNDTQDFYITLDLTTYVPDALAVRPKTRTAPQPDNNADTSHQSGSDAASVSAGSLQILDLHTRNPSIQFNGRTYNGSWSTDYGSQLFVAKSGTVQHPILAGNVLDIVGASRARIIATPAKPRNKYMSHAQSDVPDDANKPSTNTLPSNTASDSATTESNNALSEKGPSNSGSQAASFLQRLAQIKQRKGEKDPVPTYSVKIYNAPSAEAQQAIRDAALQDDADRGSRAADLPPSKRRRYPRDGRTSLADARSASSSGAVATASSNTTMGRPSREILAQRLGFQDAAARHSMLPTAGFEVRQDVQILSSGDEDDDDDEGDEDER